MGFLAVLVIAINLLHDVDVIVSVREKLCQVGSAGSVYLKDHFRIAHQITILLSGVRDGYKTVAFRGLPDVLNR